MTFVNTEIETMAIIHDDVKEDSVTSPVLESVNLFLGEDELSPSDLTWVDSFLNNEDSVSSVPTFQQLDSMDVSNTDWNSYKEVLSEIFKYQSGQVGSVEAEKNTRLNIDGVNSFRAYIASLARGSKSDEDEDPREDDIANIGSLRISDDEVDDPTIANRKVGVRGKGRLENVFGPNYSEDVVKVESNDTSADFNSITWEVESSKEDIFKVWDLGISDEQDDFTEQMNKALDEVALPVNSVVLTPWEDVLNVSIDDLISGLGDLSLKKDTN